MKKDGLSLKQREAAELLATSHKTDEQIADLLNISINTLRFWKSEIKFKVFVFQLFEERLEYERNRRIKRISKYLQPVYRAIRIKLRDKEIVRNLGIKDLLKIMAQLHYEIRQDKLAFKTQTSIPKEESVEPRDVNESDSDMDDSDVDAASMARELYLNERRAASGKVVPINRTRE